MNFLFYLANSVSKEKIHTHAFSFLCEPFPKEIVFSRSLRCPWVVESFMGVGSTFISAGACAGLSNVNFASISPPSVVFLCIAWKKQGNYFSGPYFLQNSGLDFANKRSHPIYKGYSLPCSWRYWRITMASQQTREEEHYFPAADWGSWYELLTIRSSPWEPPNLILKMKMLGSLLSLPPPMVLYLVTISSTVTALALPAT